MWDAVNSMHCLRLISVDTFTSIFSRLASAGHVHDANAAFKAMEKLDCSPDVEALNSLISTLCCCGHTPTAWDFFLLNEPRIHLDRHTFAILLEGWENAGNTMKARDTFMVMVDLTGWGPVNVPAYDSFLSTFLKDPNGNLQTMMSFFRDMTDRSCYPGMKFFYNALKEFFWKRKHRDAMML